MINKFNKIIHNNYSRFFKFIFFLRYLIAIFFISSILFLVIPSFFDYEKKEIILNNYLSNSYNFEISNYEKIVFKALPFPKLIIKNTTVKLNSSPIEMKVKNLIIYPKLINIYNYENYQSNKIVLKDSYTKLNFAESKKLIKYFLGGKNNFFLDNLEINIFDKDKSIISVKDIKFSNFGYKKNKVSGEVFEKKFKIRIDNKFENINFKLLKTGIDTDIYLKKKKKNFISGVFKSKILKTNVKFDFDYDAKLLNVNNLFLRNKNLSLNSKSVIKLDPFFDINSKIDVDDINPKLFSNFNFFKLFKSKEIFQRINSNNEINFKSKNFKRNFFEKLNLTINLAYGRMNYKKKVFMGKSLFQCEGVINLLEEFPILFFNCEIISDDKKEFLAKFDIKSKKNNETFKIEFTGNMNVLNEKINFKKIIMNKNYKASAEDLKYFKSSFEKLVFDTGFVEIFNLKKMRKFILEVS